MVMVPIYVTTIVFLIYQAYRHWRLYLTAREEVERLDREIKEMLVFDRAATAHEGLCGCKEGA